jgi:hypothetical protein
VQTCTETIENILVNTVLCQKPVEEPNHDLYKHTTIFNTEWKAFAKETGKDSGEITGLLNKSILTNYSVVLVLHMTSYYYANM